MYYWIRKSLHHFTQLVSLSKLFLSLEERDVENEKLGQRILARNSLFALNGLLLRLRCATNSIDRLKQTECYKHEMCYFASVCNFTINAVFL